ncbi:hypothetical protein [Ancylomarina subtilis]|nr:hypothetical protein [Ancylomarina subtilis]
MKKENKLELGKKSIANLSKPEMLNTKGGWYATYTAVCAAMQTKKVTDKK